MLMRTTRHRCSLSVWSHIAALPAFLMCGAVLSAQDPGTATSHERSLVRADRASPHVGATRSRWRSQPDTLLARLGQLEVDTARQLRLATRADYFPQIATIFTTRISTSSWVPNSSCAPLGALGALGAPTIGFPLFGQDQTFIAFNAIQPITPLFKVREAVAIARADEDIARAKTATAGATEQAPSRKTTLTCLLRSTRWRSLKPESGTARPDDWLQRDLRNGERGPRHEAKREKLKGRWRGIGRVKDTDRLPQ